jgi:hypothetical protein
MPQFQDTTGAAWKIDLTVDDILRVKEETDGEVNLLSPHSGEPPISARLTEDVELFCDVLYALLKPQLDAQQLDARAFAARLGGTALANANDAFLEAWIDFFLQRRKPAQAEMIRKGQAANAEANALATERLQAIDVAAEIRKQFSLTSPPPSSTPSGGSPDSSASIPADSVTDNST